MKNEYGKKVEIKILEGDTVTFKSELEAIAYARAQRSYHYQLFDDKGRHAGYAVPK